MAYYKNHRNQPYFDLMKEGKKTIEGRLYRGKFALIKAGDQIEVFTPEEDESFLVKVLDSRKYETVRNMLEAEGLEKVLPNINNIEEGVAVYRNFYSEEEEKETGVVAIEVERIE